MLQLTQNTQTIQPVWQDLYLALEAEFGKEIFGKWLSKLELYSLSDHEIIASVPSKFLRDWIKREYLEKIKTIWLKLIPTLHKFSIICIEPAAEIKEIAVKADENKIVNLSKYDNVFSFGTDLNPKFTFENFAVGKCNQLAFKAAQVIAGEQNQTIAASDVNPLFLYGGVGMGKTHLGQAIAWHIKNHDKKSKAVYLSAERFMHQFVQSIRNKDVVEFKEKFRSIDLLIIDDLQFIIGKEGTQEELLYTISSLVEDNKKVVLICDRSPGDLNNIGDKLKSRMSAGMVIDFKCPDYETRLEILKLKAKTIEPAIAPEVLELLASKINSSIRDLEGALKKLVVNQVLTGEAISLQAAETLLQDLFRTTSNVITIEDIKKTIADFFAINIKDLSSNCRSRKVARPRQVAMYLSKILTTKSLPDIGNAFGGKNHATVIHAVKTIKKMMEQDADFANNIKNIENKISS
ncbi:MAG: chromosomal replication initiation protein [Rickettsiaceae bacterium]|jgi:chromosomal replication initiator protein|nr:chromosomal replication initiation protein [Rickettsiaceae bacterium]